MLTNPLSPPESVSMDTSGNMEPTMMRVMTVCLLPRESYAAGGAVPCGDAKGCVRVEVPYSVTMRDLAAELVRATSVPTATMRVREWLGMNAHRNAEDDAARVSAVHMYVVDCSASESGEPGELVPVPPVTRVEEVASLAHDGSVSGHPELTVYYAQDHKFGDISSDCSNCVDVCECCMECCAKASKSKPKPQNQQNKQQQRPRSRPSTNQNAQPQPQPRPAIIYGVPAPDSNGRPPSGQDNNGQLQNATYAQAPNDYDQAYTGSYPPRQPTQGMAFVGRPTQSAKNGQATHQDGNTTPLNNNTNNCDARARLDEPQHTSADYPGTRTDTLDPQVVVLSLPLRAPPPAAGAAPEFSPSEGRDEFDYPTERPPLASSDGGLPPPQYKLSGFDNGSATFDEAKKPGK